MFPFGLCVSVCMCMCIGGGDKGLKVWGKIANCLVNTNSKVTVPPSVKIQIGEFGETKLFRKDFMSFKFKNNLD